MRKITLPAARPALLAPRYLREWMGVEPTRADSTPLNGFEDRGPHRESTTPIDNEPMNQFSNEPNARVLFGSLGNWIIVESITRVLFCQNVRVQVSLRAAAGGEAISNSKSGRPEGGFVGTNRLLATLAWLWRDCAELRTAMRHNHVPARASLTQS